MEDFWGVMVSRSLFGIVIVGWLSFWFLECVFVKQNGVVEALALLFQQQRSNTVSLSGLVVVFFYGALMMCVRYGP